MSWRTSSAVGRLCVPDLFFKRWMRTPLSCSPLLLGSPVAVVALASCLYIGAIKVESPPLDVRARRTVILESVADENHLNPLILHGPSGIFSSFEASWISEVGMCTAVVSVNDTSLPPVRSVIHWPLVHAC